MKVFHIIIAVIAAYLIYIYFCTNTETFGEPSKWNIMAVVGIFTAVFSFILILIIGYYYFKDNRKRLPFDTTEKFKYSVIPEPLALLGDKKN